MTWRRYAVYCGLAGLFAFSLLPVAGVFFEAQPIIWTNSPFPTTSPVIANRPLATSIERCNKAPRTIVTHVARRLINEDMPLDDERRVTTLIPGAGIVEPGCTSQTGGIGLPPACREGETKGCTIMGHRYYVEQFVEFRGNWRTFTERLRTQSFVVEEDGNAP